MKIEDLARLDTDNLNQYRKVVAETLADLKAVEKNLRVLVIQNNLDKTPNLLSGEDTSAQERIHSAQFILDTLKNVRNSIDKLPTE